MRRGGHHLLGSVRIPFRAWRAARHRYWKPDVYQWLGLHFGFAGPIHATLGAILVDIARPSYLYAIEGPAGIKLGRSFNPSSRMRDLTGALSGLGIAERPTLHLVATVPEWAITEAMAHERWESLRTHGEWFTPTPELRAWIAAWPAIRRARARVIRRWIQLLSSDHDAKPLAKLAANEEATARSVRRREMDALLASGCQSCHGRIPRQRLEIRMCGACERALDDARVQAAIERVTKAHAALAEILDRRRMAKAVAA